MPGCRDSEISVFCCAGAGEPGSVIPIAAMAPTAARHIRFFILHSLFIAIDAFVAMEFVSAPAIRHAAPFIAELNATIARQQQFAKAGDFEKLMAADNEFHAQLYAATDKGDIWSLVKSRSGHIDRLRRMHLPSPGKAQDIVRHHRLIAKSIDSGEPDEAQKHLRTHLSGTLSELARIRSRYPEYLSN